MNNETDRAKQELLTAAGRAYQIGIQTGNGGNLSCRVEGTDTIIIKPSGCSFGECTADNLVTVNLQGKQTAGPGLPSREVYTHLTIYRKRSDVLGIFHCHSPWAIAVAEFDTEIPCVTMHSQAKIGPIPVLNVPGGHADEAVKNAVNQLMNNNPELKVFVQAQHGIFSLSKSIIIAEHNAELVEETAQIAWLITNRKPPGK